MKKLIIVSLVVVAALAAGCASVPCAPPMDKATCQVNYYTGLAEQVDATCQGLLAANPQIGGSARQWIVAYHNALPNLKAAALDGLAAYEAGTSKDYLTALNALIAMYTQVNAVVVANGQPSPLAAAKLRMPAQ